MDASVSYILNFLRGVDFTGAISIDSSSMNEECYTAVFMHNEYIFSHGAGLVLLGAEHKLPAKQKFAPQDMILPAKQEFACKTLTL